jgi:hypothetical protein
MLFHCRRDGGRACRTSPDYVARHIIGPEYLEAFVEQALREMRAEETGTAGNHGTSLHRDTPPVDRGRQGCSTYMT